MVQGS